MEKQRVHITEVCARDGFQNIKEFIPTEDKIAIAKKLMVAGFPEIEVASFVSPKWIPQMADGKEVLEELIAYRKANNIPVQFMALAPNQRGIENAIAAKAENISCPISASAKHNMSNVNCTREKSFENLESVVGKIHDAGIDLTIGLACSFGTPFLDDEILVDDVLWMLERSFKMGAKKVILADTVGNGAPDFVREVLTAVKGHFDMDMFTIHMHDTMGLALINCMEGYRQGIRSFESAAGGLGGCQFAPGAAGNIATEDLVNFFELQGIPTNIDMEKVLDAVSMIQSSVNGKIVSRFYPYSRQSQ